MFVAVFVRRLREGKTYEDFLEAWYPDASARIGEARSMTSTCASVVGEGWGNLDERRFLFLTLIGLRVLFGDPYAMRARKA
jgi:hypothetical protein